MMNRELKTDIVQSAAVLGQELTSCMRRSEFKAGEKKVMASIPVAEPPSRSVTKQLLPLYRHVTSLLWLDYRL